MENTAIIRWTILSALVISLALAEISCPTNWTQIERQCFLEVADSVSRNSYSRRFYCLGERGDVATFDPPADYQSSVADKFNSTEYYIGLTDIGEKGTFRWTDGDESLLDGTWADGQPNGATADNCVIVSGNPPVWSVTTCNSNKPFICERRSGNPPCGLIEGHPYPWQGMTRMGTRTCSATLINRGWAVISGRCRGNFIVFGDPMNVADHSDQTPRIGSNPSSTVQVSNATKFRENNHPLNATNNMDMMRLRDPVVVTDSVRPSCLYQPPSLTNNGRLSELVDLENCRITGWPKNGGSISETNVTLSDTMQCADQGIGVLCAKSADVSCKVSLGDPLMCWHKTAEKFMMVGLVFQRWNGYQCSDPKLPNRVLFTRLATMQGFIQRTQATAEDSLFRCPNGDIIQDKDVCNNVVDCYDDFADELGCDIDETLAAGGELELTSPKYETASNDELRSWIYFPKPSETLRMTFSCNSVPYFGGLLYMRNRTEGFQAVSSVNQVEGGSEVTIDGLEGQPIVLVMVKEMEEVQAGFQATVQSV